MASFGLVWPRICSGAFSGRVFLDMALFFCFFVDFVFKAGCVGNGKGASILGAFFLRMIFGT